MSFLCLGILHFSCVISQQTFNTYADSELHENIVNQMDAPILTFDNPLHDFGDVIKGTVKYHTFTFRNTGGEDLVIEIATGCSCTTIDYPTLPIPTGETGEIKIKFDSSQKELGLVDVDIDVIANTKSVLTIAHFVANIVTP